MKTNCFNAYDIRGRIPDELNPELAKRIAYVFAKYLDAKKVAVGYDIRLSSPAMAEAVMQGLQLAGCEAINIGLCGTENIYFATANSQLDGGIMVTASHNPQDYNGLKMVQAGSRPVGTDSGLHAIREMVEDDSLVLPTELVAERSELDSWDDYTKHLLSYIDTSKIRPLKIVANPGNGGAGLVIERIQQHLPCEFIPLDFEPDGSFPQGVPNPLLIENQQRTADKVREEGADLGIAWDGDYDRCFLFDENGQFVNGYYIVGLISKALLHQNPAANIIYEPRLMWNTEEVVKQYGGAPILSRTGHAFIKQSMRDVDAIYGGEISGHHYFQAFHYCDSGMIPWLLIIDILSREDAKLSELVSEFQQKHPASDEMNRRVEDAPAIIDRVEKYYGELGAALDHTDGLSVAFDDWRFNLRMSNTEPLLRLNVETRADQAQLAQRIDELNNLLDG